MPDNFPSMVWGAATVIAGMVAAMAGVWYLHEAPTPDERKNQQITIERELERILTNQQIIIDGQIKIIENLVKNNMELQATKQKVEATKQKVESVEEVKRKYKR